MRNLGFLGVLAAAIFLYGGPAFATTYTLTAAKEFIATGGYSGTIDPVASVVGPVNSLVGTAGSDQVIFRVTIDPGSLPIDFFQAAVFNASPAAGGGEAGIGIVPSSAAFEPAGSPSENVRFLFSSPLSGSQTSSTLVIEYAAGVLDAALITSGGTLFGSFKAKRAGGSEFDAGFAALEAVQAPVPEPAGLLLFGLIALGLARRRGSG